MMYHDFPLFYSPFAHGLFFALVPFIIIAAVWTLVLKGFALWYAARGEQKGWFVALLLINTLGVLELVYLIWFRPGASAAPTHHDHDHHAHHDAPAHSSSPQ